MNRLKFSKKRLILTIVYFILCTSFYLYRYSLSYSHKYVRQILFFFGTGFLILTLVSFSKLFTSEIREKIFRRIGKALFNATSFIRVFIKKAKKKLGIEDKYYISGNDERQIIYDSKKKRKNSRHKHTKVKYTDMTTNKERIRFLWAKYVLSLIDLDHNPHIYDTPIEIGKALNPPEDSAPLFALYYKARYTSDDETISDKDVNTQAEFVGTKGKI